KRARTERIVGTAGHIARQIRPALEHFFRRTPVRPFAFRRDRLYARPPETVAPDADAVARRHPAFFDEVQIALAAVDHDRARLFLAVIGDLLRQELRIDGARLRPGRHIGLFAPRLDQRPVLIGIAAVIFVL